MKKTLSIILLLILSFYLFLIGDGFLNDQVLESDTQRYGVVYGNKVELDGTPSHRLVARLDAGYDLYERGIISKIIVSGGVGVEGFDEAKIMGEYLEERGIEREDIIIDSDGYTTRKTSENIGDFIDVDPQVIGITQWYHISRVKLSLKQAGFTNVYGFAPKYLEKRDIYSIIREGPAYIKYLLKL